MKCNDVKPGMWVRTHSVGKPTGMLIEPKYLEARREGVLGYVGYWVGGHGGDVWWVRHYDPDALVDEIAAYGFWEMEPAEAPAEPPEGVNILD